MRGIKGFVLGFSLSLFSMSLTGQLYSSVSPQENSKVRPHDIKIDLFKKKNNAVSVVPKVVFSEIKKQQPTDKSDNVSISSTIAGNLPQAETLSQTDGEGFEDDEILNINPDGGIPIEFSNTNEEMPDAEVLYGEDSGKVAMLSADALAEGDDFISDSPWVVAKGSKHIKNKKFLEQFQNDMPENLFSDSFNQTKNEEDALSYKVAERIKQSIIFPIPDEILNDENLTPTFISSESANKLHPAKKNIPTTKPKPVAKDSLKIITKEQTPSQKQAESKGIMNSISSWFSDKPKPAETEVQKSKPSPAYSSQGERPVADKIDNSDALISFYESIQEAKEEQVQNKIIPTELKLSFQSGRAEISGQTLRWLKAFSEKVQDGKTYLQVRLDANAPLDLQRKRLNLLYTIFMNNGVSSDKVDTVFSLTEPNAFVIRVLQTGRNLSGGKSGNK